MAQPIREPAYSKGYKRYVLLILTGVYAFNFIDRQILTILQEMIKKDLGLTDGNLGMLTGFAFAIFYVTLGIPIARYADRTNRRNVVAASLAVWSAMTAISGMAQNFIQLALARIGVGIGEAGGSPPSHAMISDYFPPEKRATALGVYSMGIYIGVFLGFLVGGVLGQQYGWRVAMYAMGVPGILYAVLVYLTVKEPLKGLSDNDTGKQKDSVTIWEVFRQLLSKKTFVYLAIGSGLHTFGSYGVGNFFPPFLERVHSLEPMTIGIWLGLTTGIGGGVGTYLGGYLSDRWRKYDLRWYLWLPVVAGIFGYIPFFTAVFSPNPMIVIGATIFFNMVIGIYLGPALAVTHSLVDARKRAFASAVLFFVLNLIGLGFGPTAIGFLSDWLEPTYGLESLRYAFLLTVLTGTLSLVMFYLASRHYVADLETAKREIAANGADPN